MSVIWSVMCAYDGWMGMFHASRWKVINPIKQAFYKFEAAVKGTVIMQLQFVLKNDQALTHYVGQGIRRSHYGKLGDAPDRIIKPLHIMFM